MNYNRFITIVTQQAHIGEEAAERATRAMLKTLAERLSDGRARQLAGQLPPELLESLHKVGGPEAFDVDEFLRRVAEREGVDPATAEWHTRAVFSAIRRTVDPREVADVAAELPEDIRTLFCGVPVMPADDFVRRVADRTGLPPEGARRAVDAVLEMLAQRIAAGDVDDLISRLPAELHPDLKRGKARAQETSRRMPLEEFLEGVAELEGTSPDQAREHTGAVLATLREAVDEEFFDISVQLTNDYVSLARARAGSAGVGTGDHQYR